MARKLRATHAGIHHVFARSQVDDPLFRDDHDHLRFETELRTICAHEVALTCIAACTIGTHYHLLLEVEDGVLPTLMKQLNSAYARAFNARYQRRGHAFASRYGSKPVLFDEQLLTTYRYVARNPVEAGLCAHPADWRWSSYSTLVGRSDRYASADPLPVLAVCDGSLEILRAFVEA